MRPLLRTALALAAATVTGLAASPALANEWEPFAKCNGFVDVLCYVPNPDGAYTCTLFVNGQGGLGDICLA